MRMKTGFIVWIIFLRHDSSLQSKVSQSASGSPKLEPFRQCDMERGVYTDENDPLGRVWYHIPNLGPKFCDAVRKYSIIANYREAHVIARKKSKDSECMWVGIVGDPAAYTTGSKRHIIDLMLRNPGQSFDQSSRRHHSRVRINRTTASGKRRKRRRRRMVYAAGRPESDGSHRSIEKLSEERSGGLSSGRDTPSDQESSQMSTTPSCKENDGVLYGFSVREHLISPPLVARRNRRFGLPDPTLTVRTDLENHQFRDWLDSLDKDPTLFALREPPLPSPEHANLFYLAAKYDRRFSPRVAPRKYSVADLNELLSPRL